MGGFGYGRDLQVILRRERKDIVGYRLQQILQGADKPPLLELEPGTSQQILKVSTAPAVKVHRAPAQPYRLRLAVYIYRAIGQKGTSKADLCFGGNTADCFSTCGCWVLVARQLVDYQHVRGFILVVFKVVPAYYLNRSGFIAPRIGTLCGRAFAYYHTGCQVIQPPFFGLLEPVVFGYALGCDYYSAYIVVTSAGEPVEPGQGGGGFS